MYNMDSSSSYSTYTTPLIILIVIYNILIYYSEIDEPNSIVNEKSASYIKWLVLIFIIIIQLSTSISLNYNSENSQSQIGKIITAILLTWLLVFMPSSIYLYYFTGKSNGFNGKASFYLNTVFENWIGYLFVSNEANKIFAKLSLLDEDITDDKILIEIKKQRIEWNGDRSKLINQYNIFNFDTVWNKNFELLFKIYDDKNKSQLDEIKIMLFNLVKRKYIIGKCIWFLYNSIMCLTISLFLVIM